ncbi:MAG: hypothetical protein JNJ78_15320, partial [Anaerolineae bacterium]|nr:hypothetical protein [Anaerolineae bacterium]
MPRFISPAIILMNRLKYLQKFLLISVLFAIPLTTVLTQYLVNVEHDINFSAKERLGVVYNAPLVELFKLVGKHTAAVSAFLSGGQTFETEIQSIQAAIDTQIEVVNKVNDSLGSVLAVSEAWGEVKTQWAALREMTPSLTPVTNIEIHSALSSKIQSLITQVGNNSNLILDPDIDTYYLMSSVITTLPSALNYFSQLQSNGIAALGNDTFSASDETRLVILSQLAQSNLDLNQRNYEYAYDYNPTLRTQLADSSNRNAQVLTSIIDSLNSTIMKPAAAESSTRTETIKSYYTQTSQALDASYDFYNQVTAAMDNLLQVRINGFVQGRTVILVIAALALAATIYVFAGFYLSVKGTIAALAQAAERIVNQRGTGDLVLESRDELAQAAIAFNNVAKGLDLARRESVEAVRMKDLFLATMSHELRTPLNAMIGFLHLMIFSGQMDADNTHMAERALANTQRLLSLINNILDLSRIATGGLEIVPSTMEIRYVAASLYGDLKLLAQEKSLRLELDVDQTLPEKMNQDESRISQIVTNLVTNAIKFTESGAINMVFKRRDERF